MLKEILFILFFGSFVQSQNTNSCFIIDRKTLTVEGSKIEGKNNINSANTITLNISHKESFGPDKTIACDAPWIRFGEENEDSLPTCSSLFQQRFDAFSLFPIHCELISSSGCSGEFCWFPSEIIGETLSISNSSTSSKSYFKVDVSYTCNCDLIECDKDVSPRIVSASENVSFHLGPSQKSCHFVKRSLLIKTDLGFETVSFTTSSNSILADLSGFSFGEYDWKIEYELSSIKTLNDSFESSPSQLCILGPILDSGFLIGSNLFEISSFSSNSKKIYIAESSFIVKLSSPSGCPSFSLFRSISLSCEGIIFDFIGDNRISTSSSQLTCELSQHVSDLISGFSTPILKTSHQFFFINFSVKSAFVLEIVSSTLTTYQCEVTTHSGDPSFVSETFTMTGCLALDDGRIQSNGNNRFIQFQCSNSIHPTVILKIGSMFSSSSFSVDLNCVPFLPILSFSVSSLLMKVNDLNCKYDLVISSDSCPISCSSGLFRGFLIKSSGMTTLTVDCYSLSHQLTISKTSPFVEVCSFIKVSSSSEFTRCESLSLEPSIIELSDFFVTSRDPESSRDLRKMFSVSLISISDVSSVLVRFFRNGSFEKDVLLFFDGLTYVGSTSFAVAGTLSCFVVVDDLEFNETENVREFTTELYNSMSLSSINASELFGESNLNLNFRVTWGADHSSRTFSVVHHCANKYGDENTGIVMKSCPNRCDDLSDVSLISLDEFSESLTIGTQIVYCSFTATASNGKDSITLSKNYRLNVSSCSQDSLVSISSPTIPQFVIPSPRNPRCCSISASDQLIVLDVGKATVSCSRTFNPTLCSDVSDDFVFTKNVNNQSLLTAPSSLAPFFLLSSLNGVSQISVLHQISTTTSARASLSGLSLCNSIPKLSPSIISSDVFSVDSTKFYPFSQESSIIVSDGFALDNCPTHIDLFSRRTQIGQLIDSESISLIPGINGFTIFADALYCGKGHSSDLSIVSVSKTFINCLHRLSNSSNSYLRFVGSFSYFPSIGLHLKPSIVRSNDLDCNLPITFRLQFDSYPVIELVGDVFTFPSTYYDSFSSPLQSLRLLLSLPDQIDSVESLISVEICKFVHPTLSNFQVVESFGMNYVRMVTLTWNSNGRNTCGISSSSCQFIIFIDGTSHSTSFDSTSFVFVDNSGSTLVHGETIVFELYSECLDSISGESDRSFSNSHHKLMKTLCFPASPPIIDHFECSSCVSETIDGVSLLISTGLQFDISFDADSGVVCESTQTNYLKFSIGDSSYVENWTNPTKLKHSFSLEVPFAGTLEDQNGLILFPSTLLLNSFQINIPFSFARCFIPIPNSKPIISNDSYEYFFFDDSSPSFQINFIGIDNLFSSCLKNGHYRLEYRTHSRPSTIIDSQQMIQAIKNQSFYSFSFAVPKPDVYHYRIIGLNGNDLQSSSDEKTLHVCSSSSVLESPILIEPISDSVDVSVHCPTFEWELTENTLTTRCSVSESLFVALEIEKSVVFEEEHEFGISFLVPMTSVSVQLSSELLLSLSTQYSWRMTVHLEKNRNLVSQSSSVLNFTTVSKHCAFLNCHHGTCDELSVQCVCFDGYSGEFCDDSDSSFSVVVIIVVVVVVVVAVVVLIVLILIFVHFTHKRHREMTITMTVFNTSEMSTMDDTAF